MYKVFLIIITSLFLYNCKQGAKKETIYFGGEILNPKTNFVLLMQEEKVIDTLPLDKNNYFGKRYDNLNPGLYFFSHGHEFQYVYFDLNDSIKIRLNTWDFDESLVFEGKGADKNDFLLNMFLINEKELQNFYSYFSLSESDFNSKFDTIFKQNEATLNYFLETTQSSEVFKSLAKGSVYYPLYRLKELYPYYHLKINPEDSTFRVSKDFYNFRKNLDVNDTILSSYYGYQNYVSSYLYNEVFKSNNYVIDDKDFRDKLFGLIVTEIKNPNLRSRLLFQEILNSLFKSNVEINQVNLKLFYDYSNDTIAVNKIKEIMRLKNLLPENSIFPNIQLVNSHNITESAHDILKNRTTLICFRRSELSNGLLVGNRVSYLKKKYPNVQFIVVTNSSVTENNDSSKFDKYFYFNDSNNTYFNDDFSRIVLVDKQKKVYKNFLNINEKKIENDLSKLLER